MRVKYSAQYFRLKGGQSELRYLIYLNIDQSKVGFPNDDTK